MEVKETKGERRVGQGKVVRGLEAIWLKTVITVRSHLGV